MAHDFTHWYTRAYTVDDAAGLIGAPRDAPTERIDPSDRRGADGKRLWEELRDLNPESTHSIEGFVRHWGLLGLLPHQIVDASYELATVNGIWQVIDPESTTGWARGKPRVFAGPGYRYQYQRDPDDEHATEPAPWPATVVVEELVEMDRQDFEHAIARDPRRPNRVDIATGKPTTERGAAKQPKRGRKSKWEREHPSGFRPMFAGATIPVPVHECGLAHYFSRYADCQDGGLYPELNDPELWTLLREPLDEFRVAVGAFQHLLKHIGYLDHLTRAEGDHRREIARAAAFISSRINRHTRAVGNVCEYLIESGVQGSAARHDIGKESWELQLRVRFPSLLSLAYFQLAQAHADRQLLICADCGTPFMNRRVKECCSPTCAERYRKAKRQGRPTGPLGITVRPSPRT